MNKRIQKSMGLALGLMVAIAPFASQAALDYRFYGSEALGGFNIGGAGVADLTGDDQYPDTPSATETVTALAGEPGISIIELTTGGFEYPQTVNGFAQADSGLNDYGAAISGLLYPPATGSYTFHVRSDDASQLHLSTDDDADNMVLVAEETGCCGGFTKDSPEGSEAINLEAGKAYYFEYLFKEGGGGDWFQVGWAFEGGDISVIPMAYLQRDISSRVSGIDGFVESEGLITLPNDFVDLFPVIPERGSIDLIAEFDFDGTASVQWQVSTGGSFSDIEGATSPLLTVPGDVANDGNQYRVKINDETSLAYELTVEADEEPPVIKSVDHRGNPNGFVVAFSEPVDEASATDLTNYSMDGDPLPDGTTIEFAKGGTEVLILGPFNMQRGDRRTLSVSGIVDRAASPNEVEGLDKTIAYIGGEGILYDFNDGKPDVLEIYGDAEVRDAGGVGDSGYLKVTDGAGSQLGAALFTERLDITQVKWTFQARIGDTSGRPADGYSFNVADDMPEGTYQQSEEGYRGGETDPPAGLVVSFDNWSSGGSDKGVGVEIKYQNESKAFVATPEVTAGGAPIEVDGIPSIHRGNDWFPVSIDMRADGTATVLYDGATIMDAVDVGWAGLTDAQIGFGGRTGGAWESHWFDDLNVNLAGGDIGPIAIDEQPTGSSVNEHEQVTLSVKVSGSLFGAAFQWYHTPAGGEATAIEGATAGSYAFQADPSDSGEYHVVAMNWFSEATSDKVAVSVAPDTTKPEIVTVSGSPQNNSVTVVFSENVTADTAGNADNYSIEGLTINGVTVVDSTTVNVSTSDQAGGTKFSISATGVADEAETANLSDDSASFISFELGKGGLTALFYNHGGTSLDFYPQDDRGLGLLPDGAAPYGTGNSLNDIRNRLSTSTSYFEAPSSGDINQTPPGNVSDNYAMVIYGFVVPPQTGNYRFAIAVDDNAELYLSTDDDPANSTLIATEPSWNGIRNYSKDENQSEPVFLEAGEMYYLELLTSEGGGGDNAAVAWTFAPDGEDPERVANGTLPIPAENLMSFLPVFDSPTLVSSSPGNGDGGVYIDTAISLKIQDGKFNSIDGDSIKVTVGGAEVDATVTSADGFYDISIPAGEYAQGANVEVVASFGITGGGDGSVSFSFTTEDNLPVLFARAPLSGAGDSGMTVKARQGSTGRGNDTDSAEAQIAGDGDLFEADDILVQYINHDQDAGGGAGRFGGNLGMADAGLMDPNGNTDNITWQVITYVEFQEAGVVTMAVNSDDGFRVTHGEDPALSDDDIVLGVFSGGRGASDTIFRFIVPEPGIYPMRLLWYEGGGGANVEWWTMDADGTRHLINGPDDSAAHKAYVSASPVSIVEVAEDAVIGGVSAADGNITIEYTGKLQSAPAANGPWSDVAGAASPFTEAMSDAAKFYRVVQ